MLNDYSLKAISIETVEAGKPNAGQKYIAGTMYNNKFRKAKPRAFAMFEEEDREAFLAILNAFPATGNNPVTGRPWNGTNTSITPADFDPAKAEAMLRNVDGVDYLAFDNGCYERYKLPEPCVRVYSQDLGGHKLGTWVMDPTGTYVQIVEEIDVFVLKYSDEPGDYQEGWEIEKRARSQMRNLIPLAKAIATEQKDTAGISIKNILPPRYLETGEQKPITVPSPDEQ